MSSTTTTATTTTAAADATDSPEPASTPIAASAPETLTTPSGVRLCYDTTGNPADPPLLLVQGLGAQLYGWHPGFTQALTDAGFFVIRQDNRDVGGSQKFRDGGYTLADMARDSAELLSTLGLAPAHVVGQSMGGMIAQEMAISHPETVRSLNLLYTTAHPGHILGEAVDSRRGGPPARTRDEAVEQYVENEAPCAGPDYPHDEAWLRELGGLMYDRDYDPDASERQLAAIYVSRDRRPGVTAIAAPTTLIHGAADALISADASEELHELIPGSTLTIHLGMGHSLPQPLWSQIVGQIVTNTRRTPATTS